MCTLVRPDDQPVVLKEDLTVYKIIKRGKSNQYCSYFQSTPIEFNRLLETEITRAEPAAVGKCCVLCSEERIVYYKEAQTDIATEVIHGFHSFLSLQTVWIYTNLYIPNPIIAECVIPAGSIVYYGYYDNIVSNKIIYVHNCETE